MILSFSGPFYVRFETRFKLDSAQPILSQYPLSELETPVADLYTGAEAHILKGNAGDNLISGGLGEDLLIVSGAQSEYDLETTSNGNLLFDSVQIETEPICCKRLRNPSFHRWRLFFPTVKMFNRVGYSTLAKELAMSIE